MSSTDPASAHFRIGSRKSALALIQANAVISKLSAAFPKLTFAIETVMVKGDANKSAPFSKIAPSDEGKSLWTQEIEEAMLAGKLDIIVHSLKDMPTVLPEGCVLGAVSEREDPTDAFVAKKGSGYTGLKDLPEGSIVGTSSVRRKAQLKHLFPGLEFRECRGNVDTRLSKLDDPESEYACLILATSGLTRLNLQHRITDRLQAPTYLHAVGQGALGIESRLNDSEQVRSLLDAVNDRPTMYCILSERSLLRFMQGGCSAPIGVHSSFNAEKRSLQLTASITTPDGSKEFREKEDVTLPENEGYEAAEALGVQVAKKLLAAGGDKILKDIREAQELSHAGEIAEKTA